MQGSAGAHAFAWRRPLTATPQPARRAPLKEKPSNRDQERSAVSRCLAPRSRRHGYCLVIDGGGGVEMVIKPQAFVTAVLLGLPAALIAGEQAQRAQDRRPAEMRFQAMDTDGDGAISRAEWRGSDQSFQRHDWNGDRMLSGSEVRVGASRDLGEEGNDYDQARPEFRNWTERGFANLDRNSDGRIARAEWFYGREDFIRVDRNGD